MSDETLRNPLSERFTDALSYACDLHRRQARKGTQIPYVAHLLGVASIALEHGASEDEAIAAVLHDAIEDQGGAAVGREIRRKFGGVVAEIVEGCSDTDVVPKPPWRDRKERYIAHIGAATTSASVRLVSAADKLHNARSILADLRAHGEALWARFKGGREGTLWYYRALVTELAKTGETALTEELHRVVSEIERLAHASRKGTGEV
jgi:GTP pyrophosphokinase